MVVSNLIDLFDVTEYGFGSDKIQAFMCWLNWVCSVLGSRPMKRL